MPAHKGNNYNLKWKTSTERKMICALLCEHIELGFSMKAFPYADPKTIKRYIKNFPEDFPPDLIDRAKRLGMKKWEQIGMNITLGTTSGSARTWIFNMKNRYRWRLSADASTRESDVF